MKVVLTFVIVMFLVSLTPARMIKVPCEYTSIQLGIDAAQNGDVILVEEGYYYENIDFKGKAITVTSEFILDGRYTHIGNTIINGSKSANPLRGSVVYFVSGEDTNSVLYGFTLTGGSGTEFKDGEKLQRMGGGICINRSGAKVEFNNIVKNFIVGEPELFTHGAGISAIGEEGNVIVIRHNRIEKNTIHGYWGGGAGVAMGSKNLIIFERNSVKDNSYSSTYGYAVGGIYVFGDQNYSGGITITGNLIQNNITYSTPSNRALAGGIYIENCSPCVRNNLIVGNNTNGAGGGINVSYRQSLGGNPAQPRIINNTLIGNKASEGGGVYIHSDNGQGYANPEIRNCILWDNISSSGSEITLNDASVQVNFSDIKGGWSGTGNLNADPAFMDSMVTTDLSRTFYYLLAPASKCVDAGDCEGCYNESWCEDPVCAMFPSRGSIRSDLGAYGGCSAYQPCTMPEIKLMLETSDINPPTNQSLAAKNYPNPFNPTTTIEINLGQKSMMTLDIYNVLGQKIANLYSGPLETGIHLFEWQAENLPSGIYYYSVQSQAEGQVGKMILVK